MFFHYHVSESEKSSYSLRGFCGISCCCLLLCIPANVCTIMHVFNSFCILLGGFALPSPVMCWDGPLQMARKIRTGFSHDQFEKLSDNVCRSLLMRQSTCLCNQFGNDHTDSENEVIYMNDIFSMKCSSSRHILILSSKDCLNSLLSP